MSLYGGQSKPLNPLEACGILRVLETWGWKDESKIHRYDDDDDDDDDSRNKLMVAGPMFRHPRCINC